MSRRVLAALSLTAVVVAGTATVSANATSGPTSPNDPRCIAEPGDAMCQTGIFSLPNGPGDPQCIAMPTDPVCGGGPYAVPTPPPPPPVPSMIEMPGSIPGMPGTI